MVRFIRISTYEQQSSFAAFVSGTDPQSFGYWFTAAYSPQPRQYESIIMHYKALPVAEPSGQQEQYIYSPADFLKAAVITDEDENGFWLGNGELRQYIRWVAQPLFTSQDAAAFRELLSRVGDELDQEILKISDRLSGQKKLKSYVIGSVDFIPFLQYLAETDPTQSQLFEEDAAFDIGDNEFEQGIALIDKFEAINEAYLAASEAWENCQEEAGDYKRFIEQITETGNKLTLKAEGQRTQQLLESITALFADMALTTDDLERQISYYRNQYEKAREPAKWFGVTGDRILEGFRYADLPKQIETYQGLVKNRDEAFRQARLELAKQPDISVYSLVTLSEPRQELEDYRLAKAIYERTFGEIAVTYAPGEAYKFQHYFNFIELTKTVLPDAFRTAEAEEENFIVQIEQYFSQINEKNQSLNNRKLQRIKEILDEVDDEVERRLDMVRKIHLFLNNEDLEITGGHRASLRDDVQTGYPRKWIQDYIEKLGQEETLFTTGQTLHELLKDGTSLQEKMIAAFHAFGGHKSVKSTVETLLNPNTYFQLTFKMESQATGKSNSGSAGQTYAAIALLCIARLSLVSKTGFTKDPTPGIRFMPIDEAEGLGSNFDMLYDIARKFDYQILTMSIGPLGRFREGEQYIYILSNNKSAVNEVNHQPMGIFSDQDRERSPIDL